MDNSRKVNLKEENVIAQNSLEDDILLMASCAIANIQKKMKEERDAKNTAYRFILRNGLLDEFVLYQEANAR